MNLQKREKTANYCNRNGYCGCLFNSKATDQRVRLTRCPVAGLDVTELPPGSSLRWSDLSVAMVTQAKGKGRPWMSLLQEDI